MVLFCGFLVPITAHATEDSTGFVGFQEIIKNSNPGALGDPASTTYYDYKDETNKEKIFTGKIDENGKTSLLAFIIKLVTWLTVLLSTIFVVMLVLAGYFYVTAIGDEEKAKKARKVVVTAIIGFVLAIFSYSVITIVTNVFSDTSATDGFKYESKK